jgi:hypothetical protein
MTTCGRLGITCGAALFLCMLGILITTSSRLKRAAESPDCVPSVAGRRAQTETTPSSSFALELEEEYAWTVPDPIRVTGAATAGSGRLLVWSHDQNIVLLVGGSDGEVLSRIPVNRPVGAAFVEGDTVIEVVEADRAGITTRTTGGRIVRQRAIGTPLAVEDAARGLDGWFIAGRYADDRYRVYFAPGSDTARMIRAVFTLDGPSTSGMHVTAHGRDALITTVAPPFRTYLVSPSGEVKRELEPWGSEAEIPVLSWPDTSRRWVSLPTLPLDRRFLQTLSDIRSDKRLLILYDTEGCVASGTEVDVPLGFVASLESEHLLVAARRLNAMEIVIYRWR